jgi:hypothetical protein
LVLVRFLPGGSLPPDEFFPRLQAEWTWLEGSDGTGDRSASDGTGIPDRPRAAVGIADHDSVEQLTIDLSIMPSAGISNVEVFPIEEVQGAGLQESTEATCWPRSN